MEYNPKDPRNILAELLNKHLPDQVQIPKLSVEDRKKFMDETLTPENMVSGMGMGNLLLKSLNIPKLNKDLSGKIASAYKQMKHDPTNPEVKSAYDALIKETTQQYDDLVKGGLSVDKIKGESPYKTSKDLQDLVSSTNELQYFPTESGFGSGAIADNPLLQKSGRMNKSGEEMLANDIFRVVHDYQGHVKPKTSFGPVGEESAYQYHKQMYSPEAQKALATETRGQNSFVNFGDNAAFNKANPDKTIYAEQKTGLLPDWAINENAATTSTSTDYSPFLNLANAMRPKK